MNPTFAKSKPSKNQLPKPRIMKKNISKKFTLKGKETLETNNIQGNKVVFSENTKNFLKSQQEMLKTINQNSGQFLQRKFSI